MTFQEGRGSESGRVSLFRVYQERYTGTWSEFSSFARLARRGPVEPVPRASGTVYMIGVSQIPKLEEYLEEHLGRNGAHGWREEQQALRVTGSLNTGETVKILGYKSPKSVYDLIGQVESNKVGRVRLYNREQVMRVAMNRQRGTQE